MDELEARKIKRYGLRRGAYDGANKRRFVLFVSAGEGLEMRHEFDTKAARDDYARTVLADRKAAGLRSIKNRSPQ